MAVLKNGLILHHELQLPLFVLGFCASWIRYHLIIFVEDGDKAGIGGLVEVSQPGPAHAGVEVLSINDGPADVGAGQEDRFQVLTIERKTLERIVSPGSHQQAALAVAIIDTYPMCCLELCVFIASAPKLPDKFSLLRKLKYIIRPVTIRHVDISIRPYSAPSAPPIQKLVI